MTRQLSIGDLATDRITAAQYRISSRLKSKKDDSQCEDDFDFQCRAFRLPAFLRQFQIIKSVQVPRKDLKPIPNAWRFDFCFPQQKLLVEIDGGIWMEVRPGQKFAGGAHSHPLDIERNMTKQNDASKNLYRVLRFTPQEVSNKHAVGFTQEVLYKLGWDGKTQ